jgi:hypothetical protein
MAAAADPFKPNYPPLPAITAADLKEAVDAACKAFSLHHPIAPGNLGAAAVEVARVQVYKTFSLMKRVYYEPLVSNRQMHSIQAAVDIVEVQLIEWCVYCARHYLKLLGDAHKNRFGLAFFKWRALIDTALRPSDGYLVKVAAKAAGYDDVQFNGIVHRALQTKTPYHDLPPKFSAFCAALSVMATGILCQIINDTPNGV